METYGQEPSMEWPGLEVNTDYQTIVVFSVCSQSTFLIAFLSPPEVRALLTQLTIWLTEHADHDQRTHPIQTRVTPHQERKPQT